MVNKYHISANSFHGNYSFFESEKWRKFQIKSAHVKKNTNLNPMMQFQAWKKNILKSNNVIAFDPIKIQSCLAPHSDRQHLISERYLCRCQKNQKWPQKVINGHFWNLNFQIRKTQFSKQIVIYFVAFDPIEIQTCLAPQNDCQHPNFV